MERAERGESGPRGELGCGKKERGEWAGLVWIWLGQGVGDGMTGPVRVGFGFSGFGLLFLISFPF